MSAGRNAVSSTFPASVLDTKTPSITSCSSSARLERARSSPVIFKPKHIRIVSFKGQKPHRNARLLQPLHRFMYAFPMREVSVICLLGQECDDPALMMHILMGSCINGNAPNGDPLTIGLPLPHGIRLCHFNRVYGRVSTPAQNGEEKPLKPSRDLQSMQTKGRGRT